MLTAASAAARADDTAPAAPKFYAYCVEVGVPGVKPRPLAEQAQMLRALGYDGIGLGLDEHLEANLKILDAAGLQLYLLWSAVNVSPAKAAAGNPGLAAAMAQLKGRPTTVCLLLTGLKPGDPQGIEPAVEDLARAGRSGGRRRAEDLDLQPRRQLGGKPAVCRRTDPQDQPSPGRLQLQPLPLPESGRRKDYRPLLQENAEKLFVVTINGATVGATTWTNGLIRPLDEGNFDNRRLLATLKQIGFHAPVGLMCFGVPGDARENLARSMKAWQNFKHRRRPNHDDVYHSMKGLSCATQLRYWRLYWARCRHFFRRPPLAVKRFRSTRSI